ncbi:hypothetical protein B0F88_10398 [Methylobacter tundripaludum]|uniref:Lipoprotein n=1 Tax=Methylobacter tundripaludum TaxID=173365 RepID=A0A2S6H5A0_9GAMM|nr:hypothetical protein [Methylobacter tundripaludum]PPK72665.1 hypothetical protein B0F88_10398 [Methylobacter tundripaludum]
MKNKIMMAAVLLLLFGCSDPKDIVLGPEPLKQLADQGEQIKKLPEEERTLLAAYLTANAIGNLFGGQAKAVTGMTIGEVLADAQAWKEKMQAREVEAKKREAEAEALRAKIVAERQIIADKISSSAVVTIIEKKVLPEDFSVKRFGEMLSLRYVIENKSTKAIQQIKGIAVFKDATGDQIGELYVDINEPVAAGKTLNTTTGIGWKINPFLAGDVEKIARTELSSMTAIFEPEAIAFDDGEIIKAPDID